MHVTVVFAGAVIGGVAGGLVGTWIYRRLLIREMDVACRAHAKLCGKIEDEIKWAAFERWFM
jgi:hypothetical protein